MRQLGNMNPEGKDINISVKQQMQQIEQLEA